jgi:hypothetical protein
VEAGLDDGENNGSEPTLSQRGKSKCRERRELWSMTRLKKPLPQQYTGSGKNQGLPNSLVELQSSSTFSTVDVQKGNVHLDKIATLEAECYKTLLSVKEEREESTDDFVVFLEW